MSLLSPRKLYVTWEEFDELSKLGLQQMNGVLSDGEFVKAVGKLLNLGESILMRHCWDIKAMDDVTQRCGRNWAVRGNLRDTMRRNDKDKVEAARKRAIESLKL